MNFDILSPYRLRGDLEIEQRDIERVTYSKRLRFGILSSQGRSNMTYICSGIKLFNLQFHCTLFFEAYIKPIYFNTFGLVVSKNMNTGPVHCKGWGANHLPPCRK